MIVTRSIETNYPIPAFNNSIVTFREDNAVKARIEIGGQVFYITPTLGMFYFNFCEVAKVLMNQHLFADKVSVAEGFVIDNYVYKKYSVRIVTYNASNATISDWIFNVKFFLSAMQIEDSFIKRNILHDDFQGEHHFDVWEGLPFGITLFKNFYPFVVEVRTKVKELIEIVNPDGFISEEWQEVLKTFSIADETETEKAVRFFFVNNAGEIMQQGNPENKLQLTDGKTSDLKILFSDDYAASGKIHYHKNCGSGLYLKWLNIYGGWDYFLFSDKFLINQKIKSLGQIQTGFDNFYQNFETENIQLLTGFSSELGKTADVSFEINESFLNQVQFKKVSKIVFSPKVCMWTGKKWIDVSLTASPKFKNKKQYGKVEFDLALPERILQTI